MRSRILLALTVLAASPLKAQVGSDNRALPGAGSPPPQAPPAAECRQRMAEDFVPMTRSERYAYAIRGVSSRLTVLSAAASAGLNHALDRNPEWGQGTVGFTRRLGDAYAENFIRQTILHSTAYWLHEDDRYFTSGKRGFGRRLEYALTSTLLARHDDGSRSVSIAVLGSAAGMPFITRAWQPPSSTTAGDAAVAFGVAIAARAGLNVAREFAPRLLGALLP